MKKFHVKLALFPFLSTALLLSACGQPPVQETGQYGGLDRTDALAQATTTTLEQRQAWLNSQQNKPAKPGILPPVTDLRTTQPDGGRLHSQALNKSIPIVLVHGLAGFGRDELLGLHYWGGVKDIQEDLRAQGYQVFTASVGPISSNWDRAAELYAQIKGGCVDYGAAHSAEHGHARTAANKCYPGFYPEWSAQKPINLIGHSMGGPTSRLLIKLLDDGSPANSQNGNLYTGGRSGWVKGVMSISSPNSGSPAADNLQVMIPMFKNMILALASGVGTLGDNFIYNFDLEQWGLKRLPTESFQSYQNRVFNSPVWASRDQAAYDLSPDGSARLNSLIGRSKRTIYSSWQTSASYAGLLTGWHYPIPSMNPVMIATAYPFPRPLTPGLGNVFGTSPEGLVTYNSSWWENDGLTPTRMMDAPLGETSTQYTGQTMTPGQWYRLGKLSGYDHLDITGLLTTQDVTAFYRNQAAFLSSLP
jgi:triacylglycerol lipase